MVMYLKIHRRITLSSRWNKRLVLAAADVVPVVYVVVELPIPILVGVNPLPVEAEPFVSLLVVVESPLVVLIVLELLSVLLVVIEFIIDVLCVVEVDERI